VKRACGCRNTDAANASGPQLWMRQKRMPRTWFGLSISNSILWSAVGNSKSHRSKDEHTRESLGGLTKFSITGEGVIALIESIAATRGYPKVLRSDNHPEFLCDAVAEWARTRMGLIFIPPGQPWRNGCVESFHARGRDECLNINSFYSLLHAQVVIADWNKEYNTIRRHSSLGCKTPVEYAQDCTHRS